MAVRSWARDAIAGAVVYLQAGYNRRSQRERRLIVAGAVLALVFIALTAASDMAGARHRQASVIKAKERVLRQVVALSRRYRALQDELASIQQDAKETATSSLFAEIEAIATEEVSRDKISAMNPSLGLATDELEEEVVDITLGGITLRDLVRLLYQLEKHNQRLNVSRLRVKKRFNSPHLFDVQLTVSRLRHRESPPL